MSPRPRPSEKAPPLESSPAADDSVARTDRSAQAFALARALQDAVENGAPVLLSEDAFQAVTAALCRAYAMQREVQDDLRPLSRGSGVSPTEVMLMTRGLLQATGLTSFEYAFWQSWAGD